MSFQALGWAEQQMAGGATRKCILLLLASFANEDGASWYSQGSIADRAEVSVDTVQRVLREFEGQGLVYRVPRKGNDGRRIADVVVVLHDERAKAYAASYGWREGELDGNCVAVEAGENSQDRETVIAENGALPGENEAMSRPHGAAIPPQGAAPPPAPCGPPYRTGAVAIEPSLEPDSPQSPPLSPEQPVRERADTGTPMRTAEEEFEKDLRRLIAAYPPTDESAEKLRRVFAALPLPDRPKAIEGIAAYRQRIAPRKPALLRVYLRDRLWETTSDLRKGGVKSAGEMVFVIRGTPAFEAWVAHDRATGKIRRVMARVWDEGLKALVMREKYVEPLMHEHWIETETGRQKRTGLWRTSLYPPRRETDIEKSNQGAVA